MNVRARKDRQEIKAQAREIFRAKRGTAILLGFVYMLMTLVSTGLDMLADHFAPAVVYQIVFWVGMLLLWVMMIHMYGGYIYLYEGKDPKTAVLFTGFRVRFWRKLGGYLWLILRVLLWTLPGIALAVIGFIVGYDTFMNPSIFFQPSVGEMIVSFGLLYAGIILAIVLGGLKGLAYGFSPYLLATCPKVTATEAIRISVRLTKGYKGDILVMGLSFYAWSALMMAPFLALFIPGVVLLELGAYGLGLLLVVLGAIGSILIYLLFVGPYMMLAYTGNFVELRDRALRTGELSPEELWEVESTEPEPVAEEAPPHPGEHTEA